MDRNDDARQVLDRIAVVRRQCDLDLLMFFVRHPSVLLTSEQLAAFVGYDLAEISASLDTLIGGRLLKRTQNPTHAARLYEFVHATSGGWLPSFLRLMSTREGRLALKAALRSQRTNGPNEGQTQAAMPNRSARIARIGDRSPGEKRHA